MFAPIKCKKIYYESKKTIFINDYFVIIFCILLKR